MEDKIDELRNILHLEKHKAVLGPISEDFDTTALPDDHVNYHEPFPTIYGKYLYISHNRSDTVIAKTKFAPFMHKFSKYHWDR